MGGGVSVTLCDMLPGQFFGELAILTDRPRAASVRATTALEAACLEGAWFRSAIATQPRLRSIMASLQAMYMLPARGLLTLQGSKLGSEPTLTAVHHGPAGRQVVSTRLTELDAFTARLVNAPEATASARFADAARGVLRTVHLHEGRLVELEAEGPWPELGHAYELLLDGAPIAHADLSAFESGGDFTPAAPPTRETAEVVCRCSGVTAAKVVAAIAEGGGTVEAIAARTAATLVCGGCVPAIREFLGQGEWTPVVCDDVRPLTQDVRAFRLRLLQPSRAAALPGQHVVLQARIRGCWVGRPYTLAAIPANDGGSCEIVIKREPAGLLSRWMFDSMPENPALRISPSRGDFHLNPDHAGDVIFLAGGIGITPGLAMARSLEAARAGPRLLLHHSVSTCEQAICQRELEQLAAHLDGFEFVLRVTGVAGRLGPTDVSDLVDRHPDGQFYLCGGEDYVESVHALLGTAGVAPADIRIERFTPVG